MPTVKEYQELLASGCPYCGEALVIKQGKYGEFIACSEWCGYKKNIPGKSFYPPAKATSLKCPFNKCDGSGLIPFIKNDKVISDAFIYCECYKEPQEHYQSIKSEDFDFPMSDTFRGWSFEYCGQPDPGRVLYQPDIEPQREVEDTPWTNRQWDAVNQVRAEVQGWREKHAEILLKLDRLASRPKSKSRYD